MIKRIEITITGRVQMVMFRDFAQRKGSKLGLAGTVQNRPDGSVFVVAEGEEEALGKLIAHLRKGSMLSRVDHVDIGWCEPLGNFSGFAIVY